MSTTDTPEVEVAGSTGNTPATAYSSNKNNNAGANISRNNRQIIKLVQIDLEVSKTKIGSVLGLISESIDKKTLFRFLKKKI